MCIFYDRGGWLGEKIKESFVKPNLADVIKYALLFCLTLLTKNIATHARPMLSKETAPWKGLLGPVLQK